MNSSTSFFVLPTSSFTSRHTRPIDHVLSRAFPTPSTLRARMTHVQHGGRQTVGRSRLPPLLQRRSKGNRMHHAKQTQKSIFAWFQQNSRRENPFPVYDQTKSTGQNNFHHTLRLPQIRARLNQPTGARPRQRRIVKLYRCAASQVPCSRQQQTPYPAQPPYSTLRHHCRYARPIRNPTPFGHNEQLSRTQGYQSGGCTSRPGAKVEVS